MFKNNLCVPSTILALHPSTILASQYSRAHARDEKIDDLLETVNRRVHTAENLLQIFLKLSYMMQLHPLPTSIRRGYAEVCLKKKIYSSSLHLS